MELKVLKQQLELERQVWEVSCVRKEEVWLLNWEQELREEIWKGWDKEIELVIYWLEVDMVLVKEESEKVVESCIKCLWDKYEVEFFELEQLEWKFQEWCFELKGQFGEVEGENLCLQGFVWQKEWVLEDVQVMNEQFFSECSNLVQVICQEFEDWLVVFEEEMWQIKVELVMLQVCQQLELEEVYWRVKMVFVRKEEVVSSFWIQYEVVVKWVDYLEELLEQYRWFILSIK